MTFHHRFSYPYHDLIGNLLYVSSIMKGDSNGQRASCLGSTVRRQEFKEARQGHRFAKQFTRPNPASPSVFRPVLIGSKGYWLNWGAGCMVITKVQMVGSCLVKGYLAKNIEQG